MDELVSFKTAKLADELGIRLTSGWYFDLGNGNELKVGASDSYGYQQFSKGLGLHTFTQTKLAKELRDKHNLYVVPCPSYLNKLILCDVYHFTEKNPTGYTTIENIEGKNWEEALEEGLYRGLEKLNNEK